MVVSPAVASSENASRELEHGDREDEQCRCAGEGRWPGAVLDQAAPPVGDRVALGFGGRCMTSSSMPVRRTRRSGPCRRRAGRPAARISRPTPTSATATNPEARRASPAGHLHHVAGESEQCGSSCEDRRRHGECDGGGGADREALHEADAHQQHAQQGDDDGPAGEHDRPARGVDRDLDRLGIGCPSWRCSR